jgi:hypothetical protein
MLHRRNYIRLLIFISALSVLTLITSSAFGQAPARDGENDIAAVPAPSEVPLRPAVVSDETKAKGSKDEPKDVKDELEAMKAENAAVREQLREMQEQQKTLLEKFDHLQRVMDGSVAKDRISGVNDKVQRADTSGGSDQPAAAVAVKKKDPERYRDGIVIWQTGDDANVPFMLRLNINTQVRYLNTLDSNDTFTDHLGVVRDVHLRNDITVNRAMFILNGYIFDKRLFYSYTVWTSAGSNSLVLAGNIGWRFNKKLTLTGGYFGVPGSRSLINTFPYWTGMDRSMADNFFRPAFTQGVQANGDIAKNLHYIAFVGNGLNTLNISANKIDTNLMYSGDVWWEPLGDYGPGGTSKTVNMYDDYFAQKKLRIRIGTGFTRSREDRFSNLDQSSPDNTSLHNSDGVLTFSTGAFAPGVTVQKALYKMWAFDWGLKYNGLAINGQYYARWLSDFEADGPLPLTSTFDHGFELSAGKFVIPKKLMVYGRGSMVFGQFNNSYEYAGGAKWHFLPTERLWLQAEVMRLHRVPYGGTFTPYTAGLSGWAPMIQTVLAF